MNLSLGGGKRGIAALTVILFLSLVAACSGSDSSALEDAKDSSSATPNQAAKDEAAVKKLAARYWDIVVEAENTGNDDPKQFDGVADPKVTEIELAQVRDYKKLNLLRVGKPAITEIDAIVTGDSAEIRLCKDEDDWTAEVNGEPVPGDKKFGNGPWGATAERVDGSWIITAIDLPKKGSKTCA